MCGLSRIGVLFAIILVVPALPARAQDDSQGPIPAPPTYKIDRIPSVPHPGPPPIPVQDIIQRFAANEDIAKKVYDTYDFTQTVRIEEIGGLGGKFTVTGLEYTRPDGKRFWRVSKPPVSTLKDESYSLEDVNTMITIPLFFLTSDEIGNYDFLYAGQQQLDQVNTYVFQVKPKMLSRKRPVLSGRDQRGRSRPRHRRNLREIRQRTRRRGHQASVFALRGLPREFSGEILAADLRQLRRLS